MSAPNKTDLTLLALTGGPITSLQMIRTYGITRLASYIHILKSEGFRISSTNITVFDRFGSKLSVAQYTLQNRRRRSPRMDRIKQAAGIKRSRRTSPDSRPSAPRAAVTGARVSLPRKRCRAAR